jgi:hypothetical protein
VVDAEPGAFLARPAVLGSGQFLSMQSPAYCPPSGLGRGQAGDALRASMGPYGQSVVKEALLPQTKIVKPCYENLILSG